MNQPRDPLVSVIIPTRERAATLGFTLKTALSQPGERFEVLVSDNDSEDGTRGVVESFEGDTRLRYVNTGRRLSMCDNWEFALARARGQYLMVIGDDDALAVGAIRRLETLIERHGAPIYFWDPHVYCWPADGEGASLAYRAPSSRTQEVRLGPMTRFAFRWGGLRYQRLPLLYHCLVSRQILDRIRERTGRLFHSTQPDVFTAFALPVFTETALRVGESLSVYGNSEKRVYARGSIDESEGAFANKVKRFVKEYGDYKLHPTLYPGVPFWINMIPDAMLVARDLFPEYYASRPFDYDAMWAFLWRYWHFDSILGIASRRREIRAYHPFHLSRYLFFVGAHLASEARMAARRLSPNDPAALRSRPCPDNIADLVSQLAPQGAVS